MGKWISPFDPYVSYGSAGSAKQLTADVNAAYEAQRQRYIARYITGGDNGREWPDERQVDKKGRKVYNKPVRGTSRGT